MRGQHPSLSNSIVRIVPWRSPLVAAFAGKFLPFECPIPGVTAIWPRGSAACGLEHVHSRGRPRERRSRRYSRASGPGAPKARLNRTNFVQQQALRVKAVALSDCTVSVRLRLHAAVRADLRSTSVGVFRPRDSFMRRPYSPTAGPDKASGVVTVRQCTNVVAFKRRRSRPFRSFFRSAEAISDGALVLNALLFFGALSAWGLPLRSASGPYLSTRVARSRSMRRALMKTSPSITYLRCKALFLVHFRSG